MTSSKLSHFEKLWLAESLRQLEADAWLDDKAILLRLATENADEEYGTEALILERTQLLADKHTTVTAMATEIHGVKSGASVLATVFGIVAVLGGIATASVVLGNPNVNVILAWFALLGPHFISLIAWAAGLFLGMHSARFSLGSLWSAATRRFSKGGHTPLIFQAMTDMCARTRLLYWTYSLISHALWSLFFIGAILGLSYLLMIREYNFRWETTILPSEFFAGFVAFFGWLPKLIGFQIPEPDIVISLPVGETSRRAWSVWLLCGVVFYGFIPRVVLAIDSVRRLNRSRRGLTLDLELPYYVKLRQRLDALLRPPSVITDPDLGVPDLGLQRGHVSSADIIDKDDGSSSPFLFALELHDDVVWPPSHLPDRIAVAGNISTLDSRDALLNRIARIKPCRVVAACEARATPDRGTLYLLNDVSNVAEAVGVLLLNQTSARADRARYWREELAAVGIKAELIFSELSDSLVWLKGCDDEVK
ncbi:DUF2868 domain-containing protein [Candidatus Propionivibrio aalborgensis]|nr:DUF2868 domain-containing protein [Candidatus Propionivibrio aalborgensis]